MKNIVKVLLCTSILFFASCDELEDALNQQDDEPSPGDETSDPSEWDDWEDVDTSDPEELLEWFEETIESCEEGNFDACEDLEEMKEIIDELIDECYDERNPDACETLEELEEIFENLLMDQWTAMMIGKEVPKVKIQLNELMNLMKHAKMAIRGHAMQLKKSLKN